MERGQYPLSAKERSVKREQKRIAENGHSFSTCPTLSVLPMTSAFLLLFFLRTTEQQQTRNGERSSGSACREPNWPALHRQCVGTYTSTQGDPMPWGEINSQRQPEAPGSLFWNGE